MLLVDDLTRDVLCNEVIELSKCIDVNNANAQDHLKNMVDILMSPNDFKYVDADVWTQDMDLLAKQISDMRSRER